MPSIRLKCFRHLPDNALRTARVLTVSKHDEDSGARTLRCGTLRGGIGPDPGFVTIRRPNATFEIAVVRILARQSSEKFVSRARHAIVLPPEAGLGQQINALRLGAGKIGRSCRAEKKKQHREKPKPWRGCREAISLKTRLVFHAPLQMRFTLLE
jgi:hypothetical protein